MPNELTPVDRIIIEVERLRAMANCERELSGLQAIAEAVLELKKLPAEIDGRAEVASSGSRLAHDPTVAACFLAEADAFRESATIATNYVGSAS